MFAEDDTIRKHLNGAVEAIFKLLLDHIAVELEAPVFNITLLN